MPFDTLVPTRGPGRRMSGVTVRIRKTGKAPALTLEVSIGAGVVATLGWAKGARCHIGVGADHTAERGRLAIWLASDGHFTLQAPGGGKGLSTQTRTLHPSLIAHEVAKVTVALVQADPTRLVVRLPPAMMAPEPVGSIMDRPLKRAG